ncbi:hypothetical protein GCM10011487_44330 [Steroidobacter agaridevorans]|uniref:Uncharacterized protein n=1 Tax=Steroidobacter agaridevorans TaxID=2695856 RepID=A0A829YHS2_9GAMM|nr:hypothetical protein GCM10011487_44330 [Steroidobacter agaridevorans]
MVWAAAGNASTLKLHAGSNDARSAPHVRFNILSPWRVARLSFCKREWTQVERPGFSGSFSDGEFLAFILQAV